MGIMGLPQACIFICILVSVFSLETVDEFDLKTIDVSFIDDPLSVENVDNLNQNKDTESPRIEKSLLNQFPFSQVDSHTDNTIHSEHLIPLESRQYGEIADDVEPTFTEISEKKCVDKVMILEETVFDEVITCDHSYDQRCHTSYTTAYDTVQEEECEENFKKECFIEMIVIAFNETTEVCKKPLVKDCDTEGEPICRTEYESECWTKQIAHEVEDDVAECQTVHQEMCKDQTVGYTTTKVCEDWPHEECQITQKKVTKYTPMTGCEKVPRELCAPAGCGFKQGPEECHPITKTIVGEKPEETCSIEPQRTCKHVTKLVPKLVASEECIDVPKEVCTRSKTNPKKVKKPVIKKWCYVPSEESGLD